MPLRISGVDLEVQIHKEHDLVTVLPNIARAATPILRVSPGENQVLIFPKDNPVAMKFFTSGGVEIPPGSVVSFWRVDASGAQQECFAQAEYTPWHNIPYDEQTREEYRDILSVGFLPRYRDLSAIVIPPGWRLEIRLNSTAVVDWTHANTQIWFGLGQDLLK